MSEKVIVMPAPIVDSAFYRLSQVKAQTSLSTATIYRWLTDGRFPKPIHLGGSKCARWRGSDLRQWLESQHEAEAA